MATMAARGEERDAALAGEHAGSCRSRNVNRAGRSSSATGTSPAPTGTPAAASRRSSASPTARATLTFTEFEVDPGPGVEVWLTRIETNLDDRIELGGLKGNVGNQQYEIPADANLAEYDTVVLYCTPFTVRIAVAPLG